MDSAPPPYSAAVGGNPVQTQPGQQIHTQQAVVLVPVILTTQFKIVPYDKPYVEYCPICKTNVTTRTKYVPGGCWSIVMILAIVFLILPLLFLLCWSGVKDVRHHCPNCGSLLAYKRRMCGGSGN
ncbi:hypothetical protein GCK72_011040 [Caenorhabditis remanei]|uniref:LITAF domain-containing protein n=1 Tax=Caenorhabditis remanei TaxID=31234 RepID=A0A6A5H6G0_CAERE|nr:hypothetical protein GCK72_011040 [Caenorhabditis remanei]KAF1762777.1 hypothetical protein GCK72_011040 [Caenorhabditis remanei]